MLVIEAHVMGRRMVSWWDSGHGGGRAGRGSRMVMGCQGGVVVTQHVEHIPKLMVLRMVLLVGMVSRWWQVVSKRI